MQDKITRRTIAALKPGEFIADTGKGAVAGFVARKLPSGAVTFGVRYRVNGQRRWLSLGIADAAITPEDMRERAAEAIGAKAQGRDLFAERLEARKAAEKQEEVDAKTVSWLLDNYVKRYARGDAQLRTADEMERIFDKYVKPRIGDRSIYELKRSAVVDMLDEVADNHGRVMADHVLANIRGAFAWQATRDDEFNSPIVRGMARTKKKDLARSRKLADAELRDLWAALDAVPAPLRTLVRLLALTGQRLNEVAQMQWSEISGDRWAIPAERYKSKVPQIVPLTADVQALLGTVTRQGKYVITTTKGAKPFSNFSGAKRMLDAAIADLRGRAGDPPMAPWRFHDLRRTARTLMSRVGVASNHAERVLGHIIPGVEGVYDQHDWMPEKRDALNRLAAEVSRIIEGKPASVVYLPQRA